MKYVLGAVYIQLTPYSRHNSTYTFYYTLHSAVSTGTAGTGACAVRIVKKIRERLVYHTVSE